ncbi:hypothetical protein VTK26DRAFT_6330 [Humicola hyalothermophila]
MQSMQRQFGKLWSKGPGDNAKVSVLLNDYEDVDKLLAKIIENARLWMDSWSSLVTTQLQVVAEFDGLYDPIVGASDGHGRQAAPTPQPQLERTFKLKAAYSEHKTEVIGELALIEDHVLKPAADARDCIAPIRRTIKKRENKRLDYEKLQDKALKLQRKPGKTPKEDAALAKAEVEVARAAEEFNIANEHLRETLPPIITATFSLVLPLLSNMVMIQNRLLGLYYTTLHEYCQETSFPSPPPPMDAVVSHWNAAFAQVRSEVESISFIARGKAAHQPMNKTIDTNSRPAISPPNGPRRTSSGLISNPQPRTLRIPSTTSQSPSHDDRPSPASTVRRPPDYSHATDFTTASVLGGAAVHRSLITTRSPPTGEAATARQDSDSFSSSTAPNSGIVASNSSNSNGSSASHASLALKKKPPPPPPKRAPSTNNDQFVVAQYAFAGEGKGDLSFREGDRIRVVKRTETDQDWWVGELGGVKGNFPANYCKPI